MLNIGCGSTFHPSWTNIDIRSNDPRVLEVDIRESLPFQDGHFDACYCSHVLEHLEVGAAVHLVQEARRVLKTGGVLRIVVPDLEGIVRQYLISLDKARSGDREQEFEYDWMTMELLDQMTRPKSGGSMAAILKKADAGGRQFIRNRIGREADLFWEHLENTSSGVLLPNLRRQLRRFVDQFRLLTARVLVQAVAGRSGKKAFEEGWFRWQGEVHRWMYDEYSLQRLLAVVGFVDIARCSAEKSRIPGFISYELDVVDGVVRKPDSLFMEARKAE